MYNYVYTCGMWMCDVSIYGRIYTNVYIRYYANFDPYHNQQLLQCISTFMHTYFFFYKKF